MNVKLLCAAVVAFACIGAVHAQQPTILKIGYLTALDSHWGVGSTVFCNEIEKGTQGRYKCQQYPNSVLGGEKEQIEAVRRGAQELVNTSTGPIDFVPGINIVDIPFLFRDYAHARKVLDGPIGQAMLAKFPAHGLIALAWTENGFRHMTNSKRDIIEPSDVQGLKIRTMENKVHMDGLRALDIQPTPMPFPDLFGALQRGIVDGEENPIPMILSAKLWLVQSHLSLTGHVYSPGLLLLAPQVWNKLSDADRKVFTEAAMKAAAAQRRKVNEDEENGIAQLEKGGMKVIRRVDRPAFQAALKSVYESYAKEFGADNIQQIQDVK